jgi:hypothetical protein
MFRSVASASAAGVMLLALLESPAAAQRIQATRVFGAPLNLDGRIDDAAWLAA